MLELQKSKRALADAIITEDNSVLSGLTRETLELLLSRPSYMTEILRTILGSREGAIIEPVDRSPGQIFGATRAREPGSTRPLLIEGRPEDFAAVRLTSQVLVYAEADVERLKAHSPDFHALTLGLPTFNRARDRGFLDWSRGWTGGTLRVIRAGNTWRVETVRSWVS